MTQGKKRGLDRLEDPASKQERTVEPIRKVGVVGAGQMGSGIAHVVALSGYDVAINDLSKDRYDGAIELITKNL